MLTIPRRRPPFHGTVDLQARPSLTALPTDPSPAVGHGDAGGQRRHPVRRGGGDTLPPLLTTADGAAVASADAWYSQRRAEVQELVEKQMMGVSPPLQLPPSSGITVRYETVAEQPALGGAASQRDVAMIYEHAASGTAATVNLLLFLPSALAGAAGHRLICGLNFDGNHAIFSDPSIRISEELRNLSTPASAAAAGSSHCVASLLLSDEDVAAIQDPGAIGHACPIHVRAAAPVVSSSGSLKETCMCRVGRRCTLPVVAPSASSAAAASLAALAAPSRRGPRTTSSPRGFISRTPRPSRAQSSPCRRRKGTGCGQSVRRHRSRRSAGTRRGGGGSPTPSGAAAVSPRSGPSQSTPRLLTQCHGPS